jgi:hypothetical protein
MEYNNRSVYSDELKLYLTNISFSQLFMKNLNSISSMQADMVVTLRLKMSTMIIIMIITAEQKLYVHQL